MTLLRANKPNFFILGAARSGSTYLYQLLKQHPEIFLTERKEPNFFCKEIQRVKNPIDYFGLYDSVSKEVVIGEASHAYLSSPTTARILAALFPDAKFVLILRNPADRAYSLYQWMRRRGYERITTFEKALKAEESRYHSSSFRLSCTGYFYNYLYFRSGLYGEQLQRYFAVFPKRQFCIVKFEEFITDPLLQLAPIFRFLGVDMDFVPQLEVFKHAAETRSPRFPGIHYFAAAAKFNHARWVRSVVKGLIERAYMKDVEPLSNSTRELLLDRYASDLRRLRDGTGISFP